MYPLDAYCRNSLSRVSCLYCKDIPTVFCQVSSSRNGCRGLSRTFTAGARRDALSLTVSAPRLLQEQEGIRPRRTPSA